MRALQQKDRDGICRQLESLLARSYGCEANGGLRLPRRLHAVRVDLADIVAADDPSVPDTIQMSAGILRDPHGSRLIVYFRKSESGEWLIKKTMIGAYA